MGRVLAVAILTFMSVLAANSQRPERFTKDVNVDGWSPPAFKHLKAGEEKSFESEGRSVIRTIYVLGKDGPNISIPENKFCEFRTLRSYSLDEKVFAIEGACVIFSVHTTHSKRYTFSSKIYYAAMTTYTFIDEDRNGSFESRYNSSEYLAFTFLGGNRSSESPAQ